MNQLLTGQAHAVTGWLTNTNALSVLGDDRVDMMLWDTGIQLYANVYYTTDETARRTRRRAGAVHHGSRKGLGLCQRPSGGSGRHPGRPIPNLDKASELKAVGRCGILLRRAPPANGWGTMNSDNWAAQIETYAELDQFTGTVPTVDDVMTLAVLEATADIRNR